MNTLSSNRPGQPSAAPALPHSPSAASSTPARSAKLLRTLDTWADAGWLRRLDAALARFLTELDPQAEPALLLAAACLAQMEGRGHTCLPLAALLRDPQAVLAWPAAGAQALALTWAETWADAGSRETAGLSRWLAALRRSPTVRWVSGADASDPGPEAGSNPDRGQPLVLTGEGEHALLYLRRYWDHERGVAAGLLQRLGPGEADAEVDGEEDAPTARPALDESAARRWLARLFDPVASGSGPVASPPVSAEPDWQRIACALALRGRLTLITGGPGTGKTYTAARLLALLLAVDPAPERLRVALAAPTGKAAARLRQSIDSALTDLHQRLTRAGSGTSEPNANANANASTSPPDAAPPPDLLAFSQRIGPARTLHALLGARPDSRRLAFHAGRPLDVDVLIVDEASMIHLEMMAALLAALPPQARLIVLGDKDQLASVEAGAVLGDVCRDAAAGRYRAETCAFVARVAGQAIPAALQDPVGPELAQHTVMLRTSRRFDGPIGELAQAVNRGDARRAAQLLRHAPPGGPLRAWQGPGTTPAVAVQLALLGWADFAEALQRGPEAATPASPQSALPAALNAAAASIAPAGGPTSGSFTSPADEAHRAWVRRVLRAFDRFRLLCAVREGPWGAAGLNQAVQHAMAQQGWLDTHSTWYIGRPVMVTRNDPELGVFNGDIGITLPALPSRQLNSPRAPTALRVWLADGDELRSVSASRLAQVETAFAMTVHKSQGSEFEHTALVLPEHGSALLSRELVYTGITRARQAFSLISPHAEALSTAIGQPTKRASGLMRVV